MQAWVRAVPADTKKVSPAEPRASGAGAGPAGPTVVRKRTDPPRRLPYGALWREARAAGTPGTRIAPHPLENRMSTPIALIALGACVILLGACDKTPPPLPAPITGLSAPADTGAAAATVTLPVVPSAASVFPPTGSPSADPAAGNTDGTRKPAKESDTLPMPGQNNDHSAPLSPTR
jgi:hypothetical protein